MIIDCHGHYTTSPRPHEGWRTEQIAGHAAGKPAPARPAITDDEIRQTIVGGQLKVQRERGTDLTIFSPRAAGMGHHLGDATCAARRRRHSVVGYIMGRLVSPRHGNHDP